MILKYTNKLNTSALLIIENEDNIFFLLPEKIIIFEKIDNFIDSLEKNNIETIRILKKYDLFNTKKNDYILLNKSKKQFGNEVSKRKCDYSNEILLAYYVFTKNINDITRKIILSSFSKKNPEYNYILKNILQKNNLIYAKISLFQKITPHLTDSKKYTSKINIPQLFSTQTINDKTKLFSSIGPIINIQRAEPQKNISTLQSYLATYRVPSLENSHIHENYSSNGYDSNENIALLKSVAEAHERFSSGYIDKNQIVKLDTKKLLDMDRIYKYLGISKKKFLNNEYICIPPKSKTYPTIKGNVLNADLEWYAPIDIVKFPYRPEYFDRFTFANSSGVAAGKDYADACIRALFEYSERHFLMKHWLFEIPFKKINKTSLPLDIQDYIKSLEKKDTGKIIVATMNCNINPHIVAMYINKESWPAFHICASADSNKESALKKALDELANTIIFCPLFREKINLAPEDVVGAREHYSFYHDPDNFKTIDNKNLLTKKSICWTDVPTSTNINSKFTDAKLKNLVQQMTTEFGEITAFDVTSPETKNFYLTVVKIITEKGIPLWFGNSDLPLNKETIKLKNKQIKNSFINIHPLG
ncbi:MAG: YcaO-like family protein [Candidatus Moraniibacteriota bacterium]|jgi:ribosomal protein S12 methylthiotransferase accessory factor YcaO